jgi:hypothetical protein
MASTKNDEQKSNPTTTPGRLNDVTGVFYKGELECRVNGLT